MNKEGKIDTCVERSNPYLDPILRLIQIKTYNL